MCPDALTQGLFHNQKILEDVTQLYLCGSYLKTRQGSLFQNLLTQLNPRDVLRLS